MSTSSTPSSSGAGATCRRGPREAVRGCTRSRWRGSSTRTARSGDPEAVPRSPESKSRRPDPERNGSERGCVGMASDLAGGVIVDAHVHYWDPARLQYEWLEDLAPLQRAFLPADL